MARRAKRYGTADDTTAIAVAGLKKFDPIATQGSTNSLRYMGGPMGGDRWMSGISPGEQNADYPPGQPPAAPPLPRGRVPVPGDKDFVGPLAAETGGSIPMPTLSGLLEGMTQGMGPNTRSILGLPPVRSATPLPGAGAKGNRSMAFDDNGNYSTFDANGSPIPNDADGNPITGAGKPGPVNPAEVAGVAVSNSSFVPNQFDGGRLNVNGGNRSGQPTVIDRAAEKAAAATEDAAASLVDGADASAAAAAANEDIVATLGDGVDATVAAAGDTQDAAASAAAAEESLAVGTESIQQADEGLTGAADDLATSAQTGADNELGIVESVDELAGKVAGIHIGNGSSGTGTTTTGNNGTTTTGNNGTTTTDPPPAAEDHSAPDGGSWSNYNSYDNQQARANAAAAALAAAQQKARDDAEAAGSGSATQITGGHWSNGVGSEWISDNSHALGGIATRATLGVFGEAGTEALIPLERLPEMVAAIGGSCSGGRWGDPSDRSEPGGERTGEHVETGDVVHGEGEEPLARAAQRRSARRGGGEHGIRREGHPLGPAGRPARLDDESDAGVDLPRKIVGGCGLVGDDGEGGPSGEGRPQLHENAVASGDDPQLPHRLALTRAALSTARGRPTSRGRASRGRRRDPRRPRRCHRRAASPPPRRSAGRRGRHRLRSSRT